jgi:hypothetical protein
MKSEDLANGRVRKIGEIQNYFPTDPFIQPDFLCAQSVAQYRHEIKFGYKPLGDVPSYLGRLKAF